jgi:sigma-B regulation protein RsbU (phosphoserine phosphatase)
MLQLPGIPPLPSHNTGFTREKLLKILLLEDSFDDAEQLIRTLTRADLDHELHWVETKDHFLSELHNFKPDIILSDHSLPGFSSLEALAVARKSIPDIPFILVTGAASEEFAVECMKAGADDYILKNSLKRLPTAIVNICSRTHAQREKREVQSLHMKLQEAYDKIAQYNKSLTDSLNYAKLIQEAMLPDKQMLAKFFDRSFIIFKPKDIVSGDFYWFVERDNKLIIAVADCTGHGVPGALMSMIGSGILNEVVNVNGVTKPSKILYNLNIGVRKSLKQDSADHHGDGMDIAICTLDKENKELQYAGANRHLVYFRGGRRMELIKGNKFGIGGLHSETDLEFTNHSVSYKTGDVIYMFTDGYADQFGGARGKRMMTRNLLKILERSLSFGLEEQSIVLTHWLMKWQRNLEQTDDILLFGAEL